ncbi:MAG: hypothetical protein WBV06_07870 [Acidimicrobiia bacterium]
MSVLCERAAVLEPDIRLRSLNALHFAAAMEIGDELDALVTYNKRMAEGAAAIDIGGIAPM